jgi:hypothetical protein
MGEPTFFQDDAAETARALEVVGASFVNGANMGGSCAPGLGINMNEGAVVGTPEQFTLLMQDGVTARVPQFSQSIGGFPFVDRVADAVPWPGSGGTSGALPEGAVRFGDNPTNPAKEAAVAGNSGPSIDGTVAAIANSTLVTIEAGWVAAV